MNTKPVIPRRAASRDIQGTIDHYLGEAGETVALGFIDALERAFSHIARHPAAGSSRYAHELDLPGLRAWPLRRYPHLVFYVERDDCIDVWRILHGERDMASWLREPEAG